MGSVDSLNGKETNHTSAPKTVTDELFGEAEVQAKPVKRGTSKKKAAPSYKEVIAMYKDDPTYEGIDVAKEAGKCLNYYRAKGKQFTEQKFVNWLNRAEKPITTSNQPNGHRTAEEAANEFAELRKRTNT
jgi:hypothetical protein